ncbi:hypothetical protein GX48_04198 [Paracoccidioides brasiliensis]|nr:hypothetical protein GX48_04198 [Paracoccidioides brasiliensis]
MSSYISSFLPEPVLRRVRQQQESSYPPHAAGLEILFPESENAESLSPADGAGVTNTHRTVEESGIPLDRAASSAAPEERSYSPRSHDEDVNTSDHSEINVRDSLRPSPLSLMESALGSTGSEVGSPLDRVDAGCQTPRSTPTPTIASSSAVDCHPRAGGGPQARGSNERESGQSDGPYAGLDIILAGKYRTTLPEDDGMSSLREKIHNIRDAAVSNAEKARLIHGLMTENYNSSLNNRHGQSFQPHSPSSSHGQERPWTPLSRSKHSSGRFHLTPTLTVSASSNAFPYYLTDEDLQPSFATRHDSSEFSGENTPSFSKEPPNDDAVEEEIFQLGCRHYKRRVKLQCYACKRWYTCRFCHDQEEDHTLNRRATQNMLCMVCSTPQPAGQWCKSCGVQAASYYCSVCKLWDNDTEKSIYHCNDCGICRIGQGIGKDYYHCKTCSVCIPVSIQQTHRCIERSTKCDCPICGDYMFTSPEAVIFMKCGHSIHQKCFSQYSKTSYRCPICSKTIANMEAHFRNLDRTISDQPMPPDFRDTRALISCNDCSAKSAVQYHWLGLKCEICYSYNTTQIRLLTGSDSGNGNTSREYEGREASRNLTIPIRMARLPQSPEENHTITEGTIPPAFSRSVPASDTTLGPTQPTEQAPSYRRSFSTMPLRTVPAMIGNYFGLYRGSVSVWSPKDSGDSGDNNKHANNDNDDIDFWGSKSSRPTFGIFSGGKDDDDVVVLEDESETATDGSEEDTDDDERQEDTEDEEDDDVDEIDIFGHR